ncbi:unnamed protein product [Caenorhabditis nigoni]
MESFLVSGSTDYVSSDHDESVFSLSSGSSSNESTFTTSSTISTSSIESAPCHLKKFKFWTKLPPAFQQNVLKSKEAPPVEISKSSSEESGKTDSQGHFTLENVKKNKHITVTATVPHTHFTTVQVNVQFPRVSAEDVRGQEFDICGQVEKTEEGKLEKFKFTRKDDKRSVEITPKPDGSFCQAVSPEQSTNEPTDRASSLTPRLLNRNSKNPSIRHENTEKDLMIMRMLLGDRLPVETIARNLYTDHLDLFSKQRSMILEFRRLQHDYGWNSRYTELLNIEFADSEMLMESLANPDTMEWKDHCELLYFVHYVQVPRILADVYEKTKEKPICQEMTPDDMIMSEFVYKILKVVRKVVSSIRNKWYPAASNIIPILRVLYDAICSMEYALIQHLQNVLDSCQKNEILKTATFLDGRFRDHYFSKSHKKVMITKYRKFADEFIKANSDDIKKEEGNSTKATSPEGWLEMEIAEYLQQAPNSQCNPIEFWIKNIVNLPILKALATQFLTIPSFEVMKTKQIYEFGEQIVPVYHMDSINEVFGYCAASIEIEKFAKLDCLNV